MSIALMYEISYYVLYMEIALVVGFVLALALSAGSARVRVARRERRRETGRLVLARTIARHHDSLEGLDEFVELPWVVQQELVREFGGALTGSARNRLSHLGRRSGVAQRAERLCQSRYWWKRLAGARVLTALDHDCAAMRPLLNDPNPTVRAQAIVWAAGRVDESIIAELVAHLADDERICRFTVQDSLLRLGRPAATVLARALTNPEWPGLADGLFVARGLAHPELLEPTLALTQHAREDVRARSAGVLGVLGGEKAVDALVHQLQDPAWTVRAAAAHSLGDLNAWGACPSLLSLMGDTNWPVRRESALALRRMGGLGLLALRRALTSENTFTADMARQVLDMPEVITHRVTA